MKSETLTTTSNSLIFIEKDTPLTREEVDAKLDMLREAVEVSRSDPESPAIMRAMKKAVPTYHDPQHVNKGFDQSEEKKQSEEDIPSVGADE